MNLSQAALDAIAQADKEGRVKTGPSANIPKAKDEPPRDRSGEVGPRMADGGMTTNVAGTYFNAQGLPPFVAQCLAHGLPAPVLEYRFLDTRQWRFDACFVRQKVAVEQNGGLFTGGRHVRGAALLREYEKINAAQLAGFIVLLFSPAQVDSGECWPIIAAALASRR